MGKSPEDHDKRLIAQKEKLFKAKAHQIEDRCITDLTHNVCYSGVILLLASFLCVAGRLLIMSRTS